jgi:hypothetical protein
MKMRALLAFVLILSTSTIFFFLRGLDFSMEIDSLRSQIQLQRKEMHFLQNVTNAAFASCNTTVADFESLVRANGRNVLWQGNDALVGPFRVKRNESCMVSIEAVNGL